MPPNTNRLTSCYFFNIKNGCILISGLQGIYGLISFLNALRFLRKLPSDKAAIEDEITYATMLIIGVLSVLSCALLLLGIKYQKPECLRCWLVIFLFTSIMSFLAYMFSSKCKLETLWMGIISAVMDVYFWLIVYRYYKELRSLYDLEASVFFSQTNV